MKLTARLAHRYLGFFLAGIMSVYAASGVILIFRNTNTFKVSEAHEDLLAPYLTENQLEAELELHRFRVTSADELVIRFEGGEYNRETGEATYVTYRYPALIKPLVDLHKSSSGEGAYLLNVFFGVALLFFSLSSFWMFRPKTKAFRQGLVVAGVGVVFALVLLNL